MKPEELMANRARALAQVLNISTSVIRGELAEQLMSAYKTTVATGPFAGMALPSEAAWGDGDIPPKVLGCYEEELHAAVTRAAQRQPATIINIGCAEGYYAIGLARLLPSADVFAFDTSKKAQAICRSASAQNHVSARVHVAGECTKAALSRLLDGDGRKLLFVDCEGAELDLLDGDVAARAKSADIIIECHDFINPTITQTLAQRFSGSHTVERIDQSGRNPNKFGPLRQLDESFRWIAVSEGRPVSMNWLACWSR